MRKFGSKGIFPAIADRTSRLVRCFSLPQQCTAFGPELCAEPKIRKVYCINLDRQPARWARLQSELNRIRDMDGHPLTNILLRFSAIDARHNNVPLDRREVLDSYTLKQQLFVEPEPLLQHVNVDLFRPIQMSLEEVAVARSHIAVWKAIASGEPEYTLVLEDDVHFGSYFAKFMNAAWTELVGSSSPLANFDFLYLSYLEAKGRAPKVLLSNHLFRPISGLWHLSGYVLSRRGARKLLSLLPVRGPVDLWLNHQFARMEVVATCRPIIHQSMSFGSDNSYSVIPELLRLGVLSFNTASSFKARRLTAPVLVMGDQGKLQSNLAQALSLLGYRCYSESPELPDVQLARLIKGKRSFPFDAVVGVKVLEDFNSDLARRYPTARFVVTVEDQIDETDGCSKSITQRRVNSSKAENLAKQLTAIGVKLLIIRSSSDANWSNVCAFLGCDIPQAPYPASRQAMFRFQLDRSNGHPTRFPKTRFLQHDVSPWILPRSEDWDGIRLVENHFASQNDEIAELYAAELNESSSWERLSDTFPNNLALFRPMNVKEVGDTRLALLTKREEVQVRNYTSGSIRSNRDFLFGTFEARIRPARGSGLITGIFLQRNSPRQEIDVEFLGKDTSRMLVNVFFNPGTEGTRYDYGERGTQALIELGFDAADNFHRYRIEWSPTHIRWYVDGTVVHERVPWNPTPVPHLPMRYYLNLWPCQSRKLAGRLDDSALPASAEIDWITINGDRQHPHCSASGLGTKNLEKV